MPADLLGDLIEREQVLAGQGRSAGFELNAPADDGLLAGADAGDFRIGAFRAARLALRYTTFARPSEARALRENDLVHGVRAVRIGNPPEAAADLTDRLQPARVAHHLLVRRLGL